MGWKLAGFGDRISGFLEIDQTLLNNCIILEMLEGKFEQKEIIYEV